MKLTPFEFCILLIVAVILIVIVGSCLSNKLPNDYNRDPMTNTTTWKDEDGREFIMGSDGSVRQIK